jgi:hypothetical protein
MRHTCKDCDTNFDGPAVWKRERSDASFCWVQICASCADLDEDALPPVYCRVCGEDMLTTAYSYFASLPTICSDDCRRAHHNERRRESRRIRHPEGQEQACTHCGQTFRIKRRGMRFCSGRCRVAAHREKHHHLSRSSS